MLFCWGRLRGKRLLIEWAAELQDLAKTALSVDKVKMLFSMRPDAETPKLAMEKTVRSRQGYALGRIGAGFGQSLSYLIEPGEKAKKLLSCDAGGLAFNRRCGHSENSEGNMRRRDREMPEDFALLVADKCEYAVISVTDANGNPYCVPVSIVREGRTLYFHSATDGFKAEAMRKNPKVCIACVGSTHLVPAQFTTEYESAVIRGTAYEVPNETEKRKALRLICERYAPSNMESFETAVSASLSRTAIWKIEITEITGKRKKYDSQGNEMEYGKNGIGRG